MTAVKREPVLAPGARLVLASNNAGKLREFSALLAPLTLQLVSQASLEVEECAEPHCTFIENALAKARHAAHVTGLPAIADDSGLCVQALGGAPGVQSARYAGEPKSDANNNAKLVAALSQHSNRCAYYYCVLVLVRHASDPQPIIAEGIWQGQIVLAARGELGFGYDPHFWLPDQQLTAAEMTPDMKNRLSHRAQAMQNLMATLACVDQIDSD